MPNQTSDALSLSRASTLHKVMQTVLFLLGILDLLRGSFHWLAPDSGAHIIAGMSLNNPGGKNIVFLLATDGIGQIAWGALYIWVALRDPRNLRLMFLLEAARSAMILFTEFILKPPVPAVPGRFMHMATFAVATLFLLLSTRQPKHATATEPPSGPRP
jgi:hypothetical protein